MYTFEKRRRVFAIYFALLVFFLLVAGYESDGFSQVPSLDGDFKASVAIILNPICILTLIYLILRAYLLPKTILIDFKNDSVFLDDKTIGSQAFLTIKKLSDNEYRITYKVGSKTKFEVEKGYRLLETSGAWESQSFTGGKLYE